jgi:methyltransferase (TIGR00027 family)
MPQVEQQTSRLTGVGTTALGVTHFRAMEDERHDRLFADPLARAFLDADDGAPIDEMVTGLAEAGLAPHIVVRARFFDDAALAASRLGCRQVVLLGAGLDTRAFRLAWPRGVRVFEVDLPGVLAFKERVLAARRAVPTAERVVVEADLDEAWDEALAAAGHRASEPTVWIMEGLVPLLPAELMDRVMTAVSGRSSLGSRIAFEHVDESFRTLPEQGALHGALGRLATAFQAHVDDPAAWARAYGWRATVLTAAEVGRRHGRPFPAHFDPDAPGPCGQIWLVQGSR